MIERFLPGFIACTYGGDGGGSSGGRDDRSTSARDRANRQGFSGSAGSRPGNDRGRNRSEDSSGGRSTSSIADSLTEGAGLAGDSSDFGVEAAPSGGRGGDGGWSVDIGSGLGAAPSSASFTGPSIDMGPSGDWGRVTDFGPLGRAREGLSVKMDRAVPTALTGLATLAGGPLAGLAVGGGFKVADKLGYDTSLGIEDIDVIPGRDSYADVHQAAADELGPNASPDEVRSRAIEMATEMQLDDVASGGLDLAFDGGGSGIKSGPVNENPDDRRRPTAAAGSPDVDGDNVADAPAGPGGGAVTRTIHPLEPGRFGSYARPGGLSQHQFVRYSYGG